jgi:ComEC/Rec2-related protein
MAGTLAGLSYRPAPLGLFVAALCLLIVLLVALFSRRLGPVRMGFASAGIIVLTAGLAALSASLAASPVSPADLRHWLPRGPEARLEAVGIVMGDPVPVQKTGPFSLRFPMRVESIRSDTSAPPRSVRGTLMVTWVKPRPVPPPAYGERWSVDGFVAGVDPAGVRLGPYGARFMKREQGGWFRQFCERRRRGAQRILSAGIADHPNEAGLLQALLLGTRINLPATIKKDFMTTGTFHVVAISGLHVGMIAWLLACMLRICGLSRIWWFPVLAPLLLIYTMGTGASASALRACIMSCLFFAATLVGRRADGPSALAAAALLLVALDPFQVLDRGFILSFCLVGGLLLVAPLLHRAVPAFLKPDPFLADDLIPAWKRTGLHMLRAAWATLTLSTAAWFTSLPLSAYFFGNVSLVSLVGNMVAIPMSFLIVLTGSLSLILGSVWLLLGEILNYANLALITVLIKFLSLLAAIPHACVTVPRPPVWVLPLWYTGLLILVRWLYRRLRHQQNSDEAVNLFS